MANFRTKDYSFVASVVAYILNGHNIKDAVNHFKVSKTVITEVLDTVRIKDNSFYSESIGTRIEETLKELTIIARKEAGRKGKSKEVLTSENIIDCIYNIIFHGFTTRMLAEKYFCSNMTISNAIKKLNKPEINHIIGEARQLYSKNKTNPTYSQMIFEWLYGYQILKIEDAETLAILKIIYEQALMEFCFERKDYEIAWKR